MSDLSTAQFLKVRSVEKTLPWIVRIEYEEWMSMWKVEGGGFRVDSPIKTLGGLTDRLSEFVLSFQRLCNLKASFRK
jgi:hypothetical protein